MAPTIGPPGTAPAVAPPAPGVGTAPGAGGVIGGAPGTVGPRGVARVGRVGISVPALVGLPGVGGPLRGAKLVIRVRAELVVPPNAMFVMRAGGFVRRPGTALSPGGGVAGAGVSAGVAGVAGLVVGAWATVIVAQDSSNNGTVIFMVNLTVGKLEFIARAISASERLFAASVKGYWRARCGSISGSSRRALTFLSSVPYRRRAVLALRAD